MVSLERQPYIFLLCLQPMFFFCEPFLISDTKYSVQCFRGLLLQENGDTLQSAVS